MIEELFPQDQRLVCISALGKLEGCHNSRDLETKSRNYLQSNVRLNKTEFGCVSINEQSFARYLNSDLIMMELQTSTSMHAIVASNPLWIFREAKRVKMDMKQA